MLMAIFFVAGNRTETFQLAFQIAFGHGQLGVFAADGENDPAQREHDHELQNRHGKSYGRPFPEGDLVMQRGGNESDDDEIGRAAQRRSRAAYGRSHGGKHGQRAHDAVFSVDAAGAAYGQRHGGEENSQGNVGGYGGKNARTHGEHEEQSGGAALNKRQIQAPVGVALDEVALLEQTDDERGAEHQHTWSRAEGSEYFACGHDAEKGKDRYAHHGGDGHGQHFAHPPDENPGAACHAAHAVFSHAGQRLKILEEPADDGTERKKEQLRKKPFLCGSSHSNLQNSQVRSSYRLAGVVLRRCYVKKIIMYATAVTQTEKSMKK